MGSPKKWGNELVGLVWIKDLASKRVNLVIFRGSEYWTHGEISKEKYLVLSFYPLRLIELVVSNE